MYSAELVCSMAVLGFQTFKPVFYIYNKLRLHAEILSQWVIDVISLDLTLWGLICQFLTWVIADGENQNLHSK